MLTTLEHRMSDSDRTLTLTSGVLVAGAEVVVGAERCEVETVLTPTQGRVTRGVSGTKAAEHEAGVAVRIAPPIQERRTRRDAESYAGTQTQQEPCPTCGCTGHRV
jgi:hypothetical protein